MPRFKQATLSSLKGVVVIEDLLRHKNILDNKDETEGVILKAISYLKGKKPCKEVISSTGLDVSLKSLENSSCEKISNEAKNLCKLWELNTVSERHPTVEVRYDNLTRHIRRTSLNFFLQELGGQEEDEKLGDILEKEIFHRCNRLISLSYRRTARKIVFVLRHNANQKMALKKGDISPVEFVKNHMR